MDPSDLTQLGLLLEAHAAREKAAAEQAARDGVTGPVSDAGDTDDDGQAHEGDEQDHGVYERDW